MEIQIRTILQSLWANFYERFADRWGRGIRYGEPIEQSPEPDVEPAQIQQLVRVMHDFSARLAAAEAEWQQCAEIEDAGRRAMALGTAAMNKAMMLATVQLMLDRAIKGEFEREGE